MRIETLFNLGDKVFWIVNKKEQVAEKCLYCGGTGHIKAKNNEEVDCPKCDYSPLGSSIRRTGYNTKWLPTKWMVQDILTIRKAEVAIFDTKGRMQNSDRGRRDEEYMVEERGVGTGSVLKAEDLFSTKEEAQKECDKRNKGVKNG